MRKKKILVVDDNPKICALIKTFGERKFDYGIDSAYSIRDALRLLKEEKYELITLDITLKDEDGLQEIDKVKEHFSGPVLFVTGIDDVNSIVEGFNKGADDYITKPFDLTELFVRIKRSIARSNDYETLKVENYQVDKRKSEVYMDGKRLLISEYPAKILIHLLENQGNPVTREEMFKNVWGGDYTFSTRVIDTYISQIRKETNDPRIRSVRKKGYVFEK